MVGSVFSDDLKWGCVLCESSICSWVVRVTFAALAFILPGPREFHRSCQFDINLLV